MTRVEVTDKEFLSLRGTATYPWLVKRGLQFKGQANVGFGILQPDEFPELYEPLGTLTMWREVDRRVVVIVQELAEVKG